MLRSQNARKVRRAEALSPNAREPESLLGTLLDDGVYTELLLLELLELLLLELLELLLLELLELLLLELLELLLDDELGLGIVAEKLPARLCFELMIDEFVLMAQPIVNALSV